MSHDADELIKFLETIVAVDFSQKPAIKLLNLVRIELIKRNVRDSSAEAIVLALDLQITDGSLTDDQINRLAVLIADLSEKFYTAFSVKGFNDPMNATIQMMKRFHIKL